MNQISLHKSREQTPIWKKLNVLESNLMIKQAIFKISINFTFENTFKNEKVYKKKDIMFNCVFQ